MPSLDQQDPITAPPPARTPTVEDKVRQKATQYGLDPDWVWSLSHYESGGRQAANGTPVTSNKGAIGVMQLMPDTAKGLGVDPYNEDQNIDGGVRYLRDMFQRYKGDKRLAAAAYNAGPGAVDKYGGVPPYAETQNYVKATTPGSGFDRVIGMDIAQTAAPPMRRVYGQDVRPAAAPGQTNAFDLKYDPVYGDPEAGSRTFAKAMVLQKVGLADIPLEPQDFMPEGGGARVSLYPVKSIRPEQTGLWTIDGRKVDPSMKLVRVGIGGSAGAAGPKNLQHLEVEDEQGQKHIGAFDPATGTITLIEGLKPSSHDTIIPEYYYNPRTGQSQLYSRNDLKVGANGQITTKEGDVVEPTEAPAKIREMISKVQSWKGTEESKLANQKKAIETAIAGRDLFTLGQAFGGTIPPEMKDREDLLRQWYRNWETEQRTRIQSQYEEAVNQIRAAQHQDPMQKPTPPPSPPTKPHKPGTMSGGDIVNGRKVQTLKGSNL